MKSILSFILIVATLLFSKNSTAQDVIASTIKLGPFSLEMKLTEVEKICNKKFSKAELKIPTEEYEKTMTVVANGVKYELRFKDSYNKDGNKDGGFEITGVKSTDSKLKTKSGIAIGMNKYEIIKKLDGMNIGFEYRKYPKYDKDGNTTKAFIETITINDTQAGRSLTLNIKNEKVESFELFFDEGC